MPGAYYNEHDPKAAAVLRELIKQGHIAPGEVDERSIEDVSPAELVRFTQCHFFAGYGVWSYALRRAGWPDDRPVWTASCPCQPYSAAGEGKGFADERHLWPAYFHLVEQRRPPVQFGEQVASKDADPWVDLVQTDLEALGHAFGAVAFPSASIGAPHIRDRTYWVATDGVAQGDAIGKGLEERERVTGVSGWPAGGNQRETAERTGFHACGMALTDHAERRTDATGRNDADWQDARRPQGSGNAQGHSGLVRLDDTASARHDRTIEGTEGNSRHETRLCVPGAGCGQDRPGRPGPTNGLWRDADWLFCRDGKWRPVESGTFPLAHGDSERVGRLRGYGNAINAVQAQIFIETVMEIIA
jgi:DNA (cytosine-5)-methyltransferase 1